MTMDAKELEKIEKYLSGKLSVEDNETFEKNLRDSKELAEQTKKIAYIIHAINVVGLKKDNERIRKIHASVSSDHKRFTISIAAMIAVIFTFAAVVSVPVYRHVVKPIIEKVFSPRQTPDKNIKTVVPDSIGDLSTDTLVLDTILPIADEQPQPVSPVIEKETKVKQKVEQKVKQEVKPVVTDSIVPIKTDTVKPQIVKKEPVVETPKPANRIVSYSLLKNYQFGDVTARREGKDVICSFTMWNDVEDAKIQMHSARAKDNQGKNYPAKSCLLNGQSKRITEKWKKGEKHLIEVTIVNVANEVIDFESISFSFQSEGDSLKQKSQSIILKVGEIK